MDSCVHLVTFLQITPANRQLVCEQSSNSSHEPTFCKSSRQRLDEVEQADVWELTLLLALSLRLQTRSLPFASDSKMCLLAGC